MSEQSFFATGRRKAAIARVILVPGKGTRRINGRSLSDYFRNKALEKEVEKPLEITERAGAFEVVVNVYGGGAAGQAGAIRLGISRALIKAQPDLRPILKKAGFLTRDSRVVERKKYGQPGARKHFQFSKR
ncbi:MAG: 30S ribosomal protein S9 [bacterium]